MTRPTLDHDVRLRRSRRGLALAVAAVVLALPLGVALAGRDNRSPRSAPSQRLTTGPTIPRFIQSADGSYRVSSELVTVTAVTSTPTATATATAISP